MAAATVVAAMDERQREWWARVKEVYDGASDLPSGQIREQWLLARCAEDSGVRREVERLLAMRSETALTLDRPLVREGAFRQRQLYQAGAVVAGRYRIVRLAGAGGMGEVYEAVDGETGETKALKFALERWESPEAEARFRREVRLAQQIRHENVCRIETLGEDGGRLFHVMEHLRGVTLAALLCEQDVEREEARRIALQICAGLAAAHRAGVIHRDLKPANVVLTPEGRAVLIDFGLAAAVNRDASITVAGDVVGTLAYLAPEQLEEGKGTVAADVYALGVLLYELVMRRKPFGARTPLQMAAEKARAPLGGGRGPQWADAVSADWREAIEGCLRARPERRWKGAEEVAAVLRRGKPSWRYRLTRPVVVGVAAAMAVSCVLLGLWFVWRADMRPSAEAARLYGNAMVALNEAAPNRAIRELERATRVEPEWLAPRALLAVAHAEVDQADRARDALLAGMEIRDKRWHVGTREWQLVQAGRSAVLGEHLAAAGIYRALSESSGGSDRQTLRLLTARMLELGGKPNDAFALLQEVVKEDGALVAARIRLATMLAKRKRYEEANQHFATAEAQYRREKNEEGLADLILARVGALRRENVVDRADLEQAIRMGRRTGNVYQEIAARMHLALIQTKVEEYDGAIETARAATDAALRAGLDGLAARSLSQVGYALFVARQLDDAVGVLRSALELAEKTRSYGTIAETRVRLGEALSNLRRTSEAIAVMEPGVAWYRENRHEDILPLILAKWGTALGGVPERAKERTRAFQESYELAKLGGGEEQQLVILQRLIPNLARRDFRKARAYMGEALRLEERIRHPVLLRQLGDVCSQMGDFACAEDLFNRSEARIRERAPGVVPAMWREQLAHSRVQLRYVQGRCDMTSVLEDYEAPRIASCRVGEPAGRLRQYLAESGRMMEEGRRAGSFLTAIFWALTGAHVAYRLGAWDRAQQLAQEAAEGGMRSDDLLVGLEAGLILRAVALRRGERAEAERLGERCLGYAKQLGFAGELTQFGGRADLRRYW